MFRTFDPTTGRYLEPDPVGIDGGVNPYAYAVGNPLSYFDPTGLSPLSVNELMKLIGDNNLSQLTPELILCLIFKESSLDPLAKNPSQDSTAWGLMGVTKPATTDLGVDHDTMLDPAANIRAGTKYLNRRISWKRPFGSAGSIGEGLAKYGEGQEYSKSILDCEECLKKNGKCGDDPATMDCLTPLHGKPPQ